MEGWYTKTSGIKKKKSLPQKAQQFIKVIEKALKI